MNDNHVYCNMPCCDNFGNGMCMFEINKKMIEAFKAGKVGCEFLQQECQKRVKDN